MRAGVRTGMGDPNISGRTLVHVDQDHRSFDRRSPRSRPRGEQHARRRAWPEPGMMPRKRGDKGFRRGRSADGRMLDKGGECGARPRR